MASLSTGYLEERTPLLIGVEGLGTPKTFGIQETTETPYSEVDGKDINETNHLHVPCVQYKGHKMMDSTMVNSTSQAKKKLIIACAICLFFLVGEFVGNSWVGVFKVPITLISFIVYIAYLDHFRRNCNVSIQAILHLNALFSY